MLKCYLSKLLLLAVFCFAALAAHAQVDSVTVTAPAGIAGKYEAAQAAWGRFANGESGTVVLADDGTGSSNGCNPIVTDFTGKIALVDRGTCGFVVKAKNAQDKGAIAVIVCNNAVATPDAIITMGGADCNVTIPGVMISLNSCNILKAELASGVEVTLPAFAGPGEALGSETVLPGAGAYVVDTITGSTPVLTESTKARVFSIVAPMSGVMNVNSCLGGADTRLAVLTGCRNAATVIGSNDDACELEPGGDAYASSLDVLVDSGATYIIVWDDRWSDDGFTFSVSFGPTPIVPVTFTVDMAAETVAPDGVKIAGSFNGWSDSDMTNNGDGTWSFTTDLTAGNDYQYKFKNGASGWESTITLACGVDDGAGNINRVVSVPLTAFETPLVCFNSCGTCAPVDCDQPIVIVNDNLDSYVEGPVGPQADHWTTWSGAEGGGEEGIISTAQHQSGTNSIALIGGGAVDCVLNLGNKITGRYILSWDVYVATGNGAYFNIQKTEVPGTEWAYNLNFEINGTVSIDNGVGAAATAAYPHDTWFKLIHIIDLDNDWMEMYINNAHFFSAPFTNEAFAAGGMNQLGGVDFFPRSATDNFFVDNIYYAAIPPVTAGEGCSTAIAIEPGVHTVDELTCFGGIDLHLTRLTGRKGKWFSYTATGNGFISVATCNQNVDARAWILKGDCANWSVVGANDDECQLFPGDLDNYAVYRETYVNAGETYYIVFTNRWENTGFDFELKYEADAPAGDFCATAIPVTGGTHSIEYFAWSSVSGHRLAAFPYDQSKWYSYTPVFTGDARVFSCDLTTDDTYVYVYTGDCSSFETLTLVASNDDACALQADVTWPVVAGTTYYIEWADNHDESEFHDWTLEEPVPSVDVTFQVDMKNVTVSAQGARMRFEGAAADVTMTNLGNKMFATTINLPQGAEVHWNFKNGSVQLENSTGLAACGVDNGAGGYFRTYTVPDAAVTLPMVCYTSCNTCDMVDVTFRVNMSNETVAATGVFIAGTMNGWNGEAMTSVGSGIYEKTYTLMTGSEALYKFQNGIGGWEPSSQLEACGAGDGFGGFNRKLTVGATNTTLASVCFRYCVTCDLVNSTNETEFAAALGINPNPASQQVNLTYNFQETTDLNIRVTNTIGQVIMERSVTNALTGNEKFDVAPLPSGIYMVVFSNREHTVAKRLVVE